METIEGKMQQPSLHQLGHDSDLKQALDAQQATEIKLNFKINEIKDLCSNCDHITYCSLRNSEQFILQCEHYE